MCVRRSAPCDHRSSILPAFKGCSIIDTDGNVTPSTTIGYFDSTYSTQTRHTGFPLCCLVRTLQTGFAQMRLCRPTSQHVGNMLCKMGVGPNSQYWCTYHRLFIIYSKVSMHYRIILQNYTILHNTIFLN